MIIMTVPILDLDKPNKNGRIYPKAELEKTLAHLPSNVWGVFMDQTNMNTMDFDLAPVAVKADDVRIHGDKLICEVTILDTPKGQALLEILATGKADYVFRSMGAGVISEPDENGVCTVRDYKMTGVSIIPASEAA